MHQGISRKMVLRVIIIHRHSTSGLSLNKWKVMESLGTCPSPRLSSSQYCSSSEASQEMYHVSSITYTANSNTQPVERYQSAKQQVKVATVASAAKSEGGSFGD